MLTIPGRPVRTCEGWSRRELLRVGGAGLLGLNLPEFLSWQASAAPAKVESANSTSGIPSPMRRRMCAASSNRLRRKFPASR